MSTMRHDNAGGIGAGTTVNNMKSRLKAHALLNGNAAPAVLFNSFNIFAISDRGVGDWAYVMIEPGVSNPVVTTSTTSGAVVLGSSTNVNIYVLNYNFASALIDAFNTIHVAGDLV